MFDRIRNLFQRSPDVEKAKTEVVDPPQPKGDVLGISGPRVRRRLLQLMSTARRDYTVQELRQAATYPMIGGIINSIVREIESHELIIDEKEKSDNDEALNQLRQVLKRPNNYDRNLRIFLDGFIRELLTVGWVNVEKLRETKEQARRAARAYLAQEIDADTFVKQITTTQQQPGQILGWIARDAAEIWMDGINGFYDVGDISTVTTLTPAQKAKLTYWRFGEDMVRIFYAGTTETERRLTPTGPTAQCYPIIDILYAVLVVLRERVTTPTMGKLISFIVPKDAVGLRAEQFNDLVEAMREDVASGTLPVLQGVRAFVDEIGAGIEAEQLVLMILKEFKQIAWQVFGVGWVQMGEMVGQGRQMGQQQMDAAEKQAVGQMLNIIRKDFLENEIIDDPWSPYSGLIAKWVDVSAIPTRAERMEKEWVPWMRRGGLPPAVPIVLDYPEVKAVLEAQNIDIWSLKPPELEAAMIRAGFVEGEKVEEEEPEEEEVEEEEEESQKTRFMEEILRRTLDVLGTKETSPRDIHIHVPEVQRVESPTKIDVHVPEQPVHVNIGETQVAVHMPEQVPPEVKVDVPISVETPEIKVEPIIHIDAPKAPDVRVEPTIHVDAPKVPEIKVEPIIHVDAPNVRVEPAIYLDTPSVTVEPIIEARVDLSDLDFSKAKVILPDVKVEPVINVQVDVDAELHAPDEVIETETLVERDKDKLIKRTKKTSKKKGK